MTDTRARFEAWFTDFRSQLGDTRKAGASPYSVALFSWKEATKSATDEAIERCRDVAIGCEPLTQGETRRACLLHGRTIAAALSALKGKP